jgi:hypothetical protein
MFVMLTVWLEVEANAVLTLGSFDDQVANGLDRHRDSEGPAVLLDNMAVTTVKTLIQQRAIDEKRLPENPAFVVVMGVRAVTHYLLEAWRTAPNLDVATVHHGLATDA